jgi:DNA-binding phage protein
MAGLQAKKTVNNMALTRDFKQTIQARVRRDPAFRKELLREAIDCLLVGDIETGKTVLRDYINATVGFSKLSRSTRIPSKSIMRMLGPAGNPRAQNIFQIVATLQQYEGIRLHVRPTQV